MIIIGKFRGKFRERFPEWVTSIGMLIWGIVVLMIPALFDQQYFYPLNLIMVQTLWGILAATVGTLGIVSLTINGIWRPTAHLRAICAICRVTIWTTLFLAAASTEGRALGVPTFLMLIMLDVAALWWAAGDAKLADELAKKAKSYGSSH